MEASGYGDLVSAYSTRSMKFRPQTITGVLYILIARVLHNNLLIDYVKLA